MVFKNKEQVSYKDEEFNEVFFFFWTKKNIKLKSHKSYNPRERYQVDIVLSPNFVWDYFKYIFAMMDHFTKYGWVIP